MRILVYGDSNVRGSVPTLDGYKKGYVWQKYDSSQCWWSNLERKHGAKINGLMGRCINSENPWLEGRNATRTFDYEETYDLIFIMLGTNDCKSCYDYTAEQITGQMRRFVCLLQKKMPMAKIVVISPPKIREDNPIAQKYYVSGEEKSLQLSQCLRQMARQLKISFISGYGLDVGIDGEHLTEKGHKQLAQKVEKFMDKNYNIEQDLQM